MTALLAAWLLTSSADLATTEMALHHPRAVESNPLLRHPAARWTLKPLVTAAVAVTAKHHYHQMNKWERGCIWVGSGLFGAAAVHNYRIYRDRK
jgi:hypothetical protein